MGFGQELLLVNPGLGIAGWSGGAPASGKIQRDVGSCPEASGGAPGSGVVVTRACLS